MKCGICGKERDKRLIKGMAKKDGTGPCDVCAFCLLYGAVAVIREAYG